MSAQPGASLRSEKPRKLRFGHIHICPKCKQTRQCLNAVPFLECAESDWCEQCGGSATPEAQR